MGDTNENSGVQATSDEPGSEGLAIGLGVPFGILAFVICALIGYFCFYKRFYRKRLAGLSNADDNYANPGRSSSICTSFWSCCEENEPDGPFLVGDDVDRLGYTLADIQSHEYQQDFFPTPASTSNKEQAPAAPLFSSPKDPSFLKANLSNAFASAKRQTFQQSSPPRSSVGLASPQSKSRQVAVAKDQMQQQQHASPLHQSYQLSPVEFNVSYQRGTAMFTPPARSSPLNQSKLVASANKHPLHLSMDMSRSPQLSSTKKQSKSPFTPNTKVSFNNSGKFSANKRRSYGESKRRGSSEARLRSSSTSSSSSSTQLMFEDEAVLFSLDDIGQSGEADSDYNNNGPGSVKHSGSSVFKEKQEIFAAAPSVDSKGSVDSKLLLPSGIVTKPGVKNDNLVAIRVSMEMDRHARDLDLDKSLEQSSKEDILENLSDSVFISSKMVEPFVVYRDNPSQSKNPDSQEMSMERLQFPQMSNQFTVESTTTELASAGYSPVYKMEFPPINDRMTPAKSRKPRFTTSSTKTESKNRDLDLMDSGPRLDLVPKSGPITASMCNLYESPSNRGSSRKMSSEIEWPIRYSLHDSTVDKNAALMAYKDARRPSNHGPVVLPPTPLINTRDNKQHLALDGITRGKDISALSSLDDPTYVIKSLNNSSSPSKDQDPELKSLDMTDNSLGQDEPGKERNDEEDIIFAVDEEPEQGIEESHQSLKSPVDQIGTKESLASKHRADSASENLEADSSATDDKRKISSQTFCHTPIIIVQNDTEKDAKPVGNESSDQKGNSLITNTKAEDGPEVDEAKPSAANRDSSEKSPSPETQEDICIDNSRKDSLGAAVKSKIAFFSKTCRLKEDKSSDSKPFLMNTMDNAKGKKTATHGIGSQHKHGPDVEAKEAQTTYGDLMADQRHVVTDYLANVESKEETKESLASGSVETAQIQSEDDDLPASADLDISKNDSSLEGKDGVSDNSDEINSPEDRATHSRLPTIVHTPVVRKDLAMALFKQAASTPSFLNLDMDPDADTSCHIEDVRNSSNISNIPVTPLKVNDLSMIEKRTPARSHATSLLLSAHMRNSPAPHGSGAHIAWNHGSPGLNNNYLAWDSTFDSIRTEEKTQRLVHTPVPENSRKRESLNSTPSLTGTKLFDSSASGVSQTSARSLDWDDSCDLLDIRSMDNSTNFSLIAETEDQPINQE